MCGIPKYLPGVAHAMDCRPCCAVVGKAATFTCCCMFMCQKQQLSSTSSSQQPLRAGSAGTQELSLPGLLQLLLSPTEQLRELQLALATAAGVPANAQVCHASAGPVYVESCRLRSLPALVLLATLSSVCSYGAPQHILRLLII